MPKTSLELTDKWQFKAYPLKARRMRDLDEGNWLPTKVPSSIFVSLIEAGQIDKNDIDANPEDYSWVSERPWVFRNTFDVPAELHNCDQINLLFEGLDTIANIWLNGKLIGKTNNMFIGHRFDVTELLKPGNNSLLVKFESPTQYAKRLMQRNTSFSESDFAHPYRVYIRKAQYQFGWDFCPALPGCGIWRPVRLQGIRKAQIADVQIRTIQCGQQSADVKIAVKLNSLVSEDFLCRLMLSHNKQTIEHTLTFEQHQNLQSTVIHIENPSLWWPAGYGEHNLHKLEIQLLSGNEIIDQMQKSFGIRTARLYSSAEETGERFQFHINGQPVFVKGANWVPASIFAGSVTENDYKQLLTAAAEANVNMLRLWGGGYYETEQFYELCDRLGIMLWQDFMFACAYYPDRKWFTEQVKTEAAIIIKRLRNHPSLVLWCGNNEIDWMHAAGKLGKGKKFYGKAIYHKLLAKLTGELDGDTAYIPTTPVSTHGDPNRPHSGTVHQWDVWSGHQPVRQYQCAPENVPTFVTEFGLQSLPDIETVKDFCRPNKLYIGSYPVEKHNYQPDGNSRLYRYAADLFAAAEDLEQLIYLSQVAQARAIKTYVEHLRAHNQRNHGLLFWQFNDCCPATSFSAIDCRKRPKALYYYAKRFFANLLITAVGQAKNAKADSSAQRQPAAVVAINDTPEVITATIYCRLIDLFGSVYDRLTSPVAIGPLSTSAAVKLPKAISLPAHPEKSALHLVMERNGRKIAENLLFYLPDKYIDWPEPKITTSLRQTTTGQYKLVLSSNAIVKDIQLAWTDVSFSDNFLDLLARDEFEIKIRPQRPKALLESGLRLRSFKLVPAQKHQGFEKNQ